MKYLKYIKHPKFRWIEEHFDVHLSGTCIYKGKLCYFETEYPEEDEFYYNIYSLTWQEKLKWLLRQWFFELCIGYHWTYKNNKKVWDGFILRKPNWLYDFLFRLYYKLIPKMKI